MKERLAALDRSTSRRAAEALTERVLELPALRDAERVFACLSFGHEIETRGLIDRLLDSGRQVFVPRTVPRTRKLTVHGYPCTLERRSFGLEEPVAEAPSLADTDIDSTIQVALILGLAFDRGGYRLGYGAGYFDRFLAARPFPSVGLAYDVQRIEHLPIESHDVSMQALVTPKGTFEGAAAADGTLRE